MRCAPPPTRTAADLLADRATDPAAMLAMIRDEMGITTPGGRAR